MIKTKIELLFFYTIRTIQTNTVHNNNMNTQDFNIAVRHLEENNIQNEEVSKENLANLSKKENEEENVSEPQV